MTTTRLRYKLKTIADSRDPQCRAAAGENVHRGVLRASEHLMRCLADLPPDAASIGLRVVYDPHPDQQDPQSRCAIYLQSRITRSDQVENLKTLFEKGLHAAYYDLERVDGVDPPWERMNAISDIIRREERIAPLFSSEFNEKIPPAYFLMRSFLPKERPPFPIWDAVLDRLRVMVVVDICLASMDASDERSNHTKYLRRLRSINRDEEQEGLWEEGRIDYLDPSATSHPRRDRLPPMRVKDPLADDVLRSQQRFHETLYLPHMQFHIRILSEDESTAQLIASVIAESCFDKGMHRIASIKKGAPHFDRLLEGVRQNAVARLPAQELLFPQSGLYKEFECLGQAAPVDELLSIFQFPLASSSSPYCIRKKTDPAPNLPSHLIVVGEDDPLSKSTWNFPTLRGVPFHNLTKHFFICGQSGYGKTTLVTSILKQLGNWPPSRRQEDPAHQKDGIGVPFLVLDAANKNYRKLLSNHQNADPEWRRLSEKTRIYTPGNEQVSKMRLNLLESNPAISIDERIDNRMNCFWASLPMTGPLPALLQEALEDVYAHSAPNRGFPVISDLVEAVERLIEETGYSPEVKANVMTALQVRLSVLATGVIGKVLQCKRSVPSILDLIQGFTVIEMDRLTPMMACMLTLFLLSRIHEELKTMEDPGGAVRLAIVIEEAHNIVGRSGEAIPSEDVANPKAFASDFVRRLLAEMRALGVAFIICDQLPSQVAPEVLKHVGSLLTFRLKEPQDRASVGGSMLLGELEMEELSRLRTGEAFFFTEDYFLPRRIRTINLHPQSGRSIPPSDSAFASLARGKEWLLQAAQDRVAAELDQAQVALDQFDGRRLSLMNSAILLSAQFSKVCGAQTSSKLMERFQRFQEDASRLRNQLRSLSKKCSKKISRLLEGAEDADAALDPRLQTWRDHLRRRFETISQADARQSLRNIDDLMTRIHNERDKRR
ncbi:MAG: DUF87 domain-containing protein [Candidatus Omnitrophica bacterium]|nr:DUF87 domain-containing protein [Candidatus Omnitrophota bacterium]